METKFYFSTDEQLLIQEILENYEPIIIADARTNGFCVQRAIKCIPALNVAPIIVLPAGEENKNLETVEFAWQQLMQLHANKKNIIVNIGGGALCDIGAFVASTYMRGLAFMNVPTTLLAMNDASFGGKNGFNIANTKNIIGTINLPNAVYINAIFLETLPECELKSGTAEIIKHALIADKQMWEAILNSENVLAYLCAENITKKSIEIKNKLVQADVHDTHERQALNFGHTIGHALEAASHEHQQVLLHGEAIMLGMLLELEISEKIFNLPTTIRQALLKIKNELFPTLQNNFKFEHYEKYLQLDKKNNEHLNFALLKNVGEPEVKVAVPFLKEFLRSKEK